MRCGRGGGERGGIGGGGPTQPAGGFGRQTGARAHRADRVATNLGVILFVVVTYIRSIHAPALLLWPQDVFSSRSSSSFCT